MATKRSRNKLEWRAHMNIHNTIEVVDETVLSGEANTTRDRFGKRHEIDKKDTAKRKLALLLAVLSSLCLAPTPALADSDSPRPRGTNVQVESAPRGLFREDKRDEEGRPVFYRDGDASVGFNEDGDPAVGLRF